MPPWQHSTKKVNTSTYNKNWCDLIIPAPAFGAGILLTSHHTRLKFKWKPPSRSLNTIIPGQKHLRHKQPKGCPLTVAALRPDRSRIKPHFFSPSHSFLQAFLSFSPFTLSLACPSAMLFTGISSFSMAFLIPSALFLSSRKITVIV